MLSNPNKTKVQDKNNIVTIQPHLAILDFSTSSKTLVGNGLQGLLAFLPLGMASRRVLLADFSPRAIPLTHDLSLSWNLCPFLYVLYCPETHTRIVHFFVLPFTISFPFSIRRKMSNPSSHNFAASLYFFS